MIFTTSVHETRVIPALVTGLRMALMEVNRELSQAARMRLRVALDRGQIKRARNGYVGNVYVDLSPGLFQRVDVEIPGKNFSGLAWLFVPQD